MLTPPDDLTADQIAEFLRTHWTFAPAEVSYTPLGHGSHNWTVVATDGTKWFAKFNRSGPNSEFSEATNQTAAALREAGLDFVLGPVRDRAGNVRTQLSSRWEVSVFPYIEGRNPDFDTDERALVAEAVGRLHGYDQVPDLALRWEPGWYQPELKQLLADELDRPWAAGPYGERARALFVRTRSGIERLFAESDRLVGLLAESDEPWAITHGEPHDGNSMLDASGTAYLIDCNALMYAPRERDLRLLLHASHQRPRELDNTAVLAAYQRGLGRPVRPREFALELFRAEWHLIEICRYAWLFSGPHEDTADVRVRWKALTGYLPVEQNWPELPYVQGE
jgi:spectinomycin phosphotransferase